MYYRIDHVFTRSYQAPKYRPPHWYLPQQRVVCILRIDISPIYLSLIRFQCYYKSLQGSDECLTRENESFIEEVMQERLKAQAALETESPLSNIDNRRAPRWNPFTRRVGLIARKIGNYPLWCKDGKKVQTTLLQVHT